MEQKIKKKLDRARKVNKLQAVASICLLVVACINLYYGKSDIAFWQFILSGYSFLLYRANVREDTLLRDYFECRDNNDFLYDFGLLEKARGDFYDDKITKDEFVKIAVEFNLKHKVWNEEEIRNDTDTSVGSGVQQSK